MSPPARLTALRLQGFKSFVDRTALTLPGRITAIVGPNGSGKSNIADAVQWVLGEQSARILRGTTMEDVIFHGAARRKPIGLAEVSLTLESRGADHWAVDGHAFMARVVGTVDKARTGLEGLLKARKIDVLPIQYQKVAFPE